MDKTLEIPELFISYKREPVSIGLMERIRAFIHREHAHIRVVVDVTEVPTGGDIRDFMQALTQGDYIIFLIGEDFLRSHWCMYELGLAAGASDFKARMFPILLPSTQLDHERIWDEVDHWTTQWEKHTTKLENQRKRNPKTVTSALLDRQEVLEQIAIGSSTALDTVLRIKWLEVDAQGSLDFEKLQEFLKRWIKSAGQQVPPSPPKPSLPVPIQKLQADMVRVEGGTFEMGSEKYEREKPIHKVTLKEFHICKYQITQTQWRAVMGKNPENPGFSGCDDCPVEGVSWDDCQAFFHKLNAMTGENYHLPSEAQWEYAARGGKASKGYEFSGSKDLKEVGWFYDNSGNKTHTVGEKKANELGLYDMSGNVWEWCQDWYGPYSKDAASNPEGPKSGSYRVLRGGSWVNYTVGCRVSYRSYNTPVFRYDNVGFRVSRD